MIGFGEPTKIETILDAVGAKISVTDELIEPEYVIPTLATDEYFDDDPPADSFLLVTPSNFLPETGVGDGGGIQALGAGSNCMGMEGVIELRFWNRLELDISNSDKEAIRNETLGISEKFRLIVKSIQMFKPLAAGGACILKEPMRLAAGGFRFNTRRVQSTWLVITAAWEVKFNLDLS